MKTTQKLMYVIMIAVIAVFASCKGETGPAGPAGADGIDGADGQDGQDGNANVQTFIYNNPAWTAPSFGNAAMSLDISGKITDSNIQNDVILGYLKHDENFGIFSIPGMVNTSAGMMNYQTYIFDSTASVWANSYVIVSLNPDGTETSSANLPTVEWVKIIVIESTNITTTDGNSKSASPQQEILYNLDKAGVDINDYYQVCAYYGIEP